MVEKGLITLSALLLSTLLAVCGSSQASEADLKPALDSSIQGRINLGRKLFFDKNLSVDGSTSCATCHQANQAFSDGRSTSSGVGGQRGTRNSPSLINSGLSKSFFWDGRVKTLEEQVIQPFFNPVEHGLPSETALLNHINHEKSYFPLFESAFPLQTPIITMDSIAIALASFVRSLTAHNSIFDAFLISGESSSLNESQKRGLSLFRGRAECSSCHHIGKADAPLTDHDFHSLGIGMRPIVRNLPALIDRIRKLDREATGVAISTDPAIAALGRFLATGQVTDIGKFRTPSLRNVALTAPYMHDGSIPTLEMAVDHEAYYRTLQNGRPLILTPSERSDLVAFLRSLNSLPEETPKSQNTGTLEKAMTVF